MTRHGSVPTKAREYCNKYVYSSCYKPVVPPIVNHRRDKSLLVGMELEVELPINSDESRDEFTQVANDNFPKGLFYHTLDCTVRGVEMTSVPVTVNWLNANREEINLGFEALRKIGATVPHNCGGHIHVSKAHITMADARKVLYLFATDFNSFYPICGRLNGLYQDLFYADTRRGDDKPKILKWCKGTRDIGRQVYSPRLRKVFKTSEFRVFGGTLHTDQLFSNVQLVDLIYRACKEVSNIEDLTWVNLMELAYTKTRSFTDMKRKLEAVCA